MNIGDYVRTKDGTIGKIIAIDLAKPRQEQYPNHPSKSYWRDKILISCYKGWRTLQNVEKISPNIIDLIEERDLVKIEYYSLRYEERVTRLFEVYYKDNKFMNLGNTKCEFMLVDGDFNDNDKKLEPIIKSILTKEQFESMEYKVGDKEKEQEEYTLTPDENGTTQINGEWYKVDKK